MSDEPYYLPTQALHEQVAKKPVRIFTDQEISQASLKRLDLMESYLNTSLEALAGKQIWTILDNLQKINNIQQDRKTYLKK